MNEEPRILLHEYDGIREYDNPLPFWWSAVFVVTIVFAGVYWFWYHGGGPGRTEAQRFAHEWTEHQAEVAEAAKKARLEVNEALLADWGRDTDKMAQARQLFVTNCAGCHLDDGRGKTGPNLTDDFQIHGTTRFDMYETVRTGVLAKGMPAWGEILNQRSVALAAAYVATLRNHPSPAADAKAAEGAQVGPLGAATP